MTVPVSASGEVGHLQQGFNAMVAGVRERERLQTLLGHHVGADVAELALQGDLGSEQREASVLFIDVVGSTAMAERLQPAEVVGRLNDLFDVVVRVVESEGGLVNKFDGDGALCIFGAPTTIIDHATRALRAARTLLGEVQGLQSAPPRPRRGDRRRVRHGRGRSGRGRRALRVHRPRPPGEHGGPAHRPRQGARRPRAGHGGDGHRRRDATRPSGGSTAARWSCEAWPTRSGSRSPRPPEGGSRAESR